MKLSARVLRAVVNQNSYEYATEFDHQQKSADELYVQLVVADYAQNGNPPGIRYIPAAGCVLTITLPSFDSSKVVVATATQPFALDTSIFKILISDTQDFGTGDMVLILTEASVTRRIVIRNGVRVIPTLPDRCA